MHSRQNAHLDETVLRHIADTAYAKGYDDFMAANQGLFPKVFMRQILGVGFAGSVVVPLLLLLLGIL
jgi:hypothetical protein